MHNIERLQNYLSPGVAKNLVLLGNDGTGRARRQWPMDVLPMSRGVSGSVRLHILIGASNMAGSESAGTGGGGVQPFNCTVRYSRSERGDGGGGGRCAGDET
jgi:hypothetical protein